MNIYVNNKEYEAITNAISQFDELAAAADEESAADLIETKQALQSLLEKCKKSFRQRYRLNF